MGPWFLDQGPGGSKEMKMQIKNIVMAAAAALTLGLVAEPTAIAAPFHGWQDRGRVERIDRRIVEHRVVFDTLRFHHIRYIGTPFFVRG